MSPGVKSRLIGDDGLLLFPLFHGTSLHYWPSIVEHGLGGVNLADEWGVRDLHTLLVEQLSEIDSEPVRVELTRSAHRLQAMQKDEGRSTATGSMNFRYGNTYLSGSSLKAATYAIRGYGSELVREAAKLLALLKVERPKEVSSLITRFPTFASCLRADHRPILIKVCRVHVSEVRTEGGEDAETELLEHEESLREPGLTERLRKMGIQPLEAKGNIFQFEATGTFAAERLTPRLITSSMGECGYGRPEDLHTAPMPEGAAVHLDI